MGKTNTKTFATVNFANMIAPAMGLLSTFQLSVNTLAACENAEKIARDAAKVKAIKEGLDDKKAIAKFVSNECDNEIVRTKNAKERCNDLATAFIARYIGTEDCLAANLYNFDMKEFLLNIGVYTDGDDDKKSLKRVNDIRAAVVDRKDFTSAKRKRGERFLTPASYKEIKNTPIELCMGIVYACVDSGAIEFSEGGLSFKNFGEDKN